MNPTRVTRHPSADFGAMLLEPGFILPLPWCARCNRFVDRLARGLQGGQVVLTAFCHGRVEVSRIPIALFRSADVLEVGTAFLQDVPDHLEAFREAVQEDIAHRRAARGPKRG